MQSYASSLLRWGSAGAIWSSHCPKKTWSYTRLHTRLAFAHTIQHTLNRDRGFPSEKTISQILHVTCLWCFFCVISKLFSQDVRHKQLFVDHVIATWSMIGAIKYGPTRTNPVISWHESVALTHVKCAPWNKLSFVNCYMNFVYVLLFLYHW